jgi:hypothetical protein
MVDYKPEGKRTGILSTRQLTTQVLLSRCDRLLRRQTLPQCVSICFEDKFSRIDLEKSDNESAKVFQNLEFVYQTRTNI